MKIIIIGLLSIGFGCAYADQMVNLSQEKIMCSSYRVTSSSTIGEITKFCKPYDVDHDDHGGKVETELEFYATSPHHYDMKCTFLESKLDYCQIDD